MSNIGYIKSGIEKLYKTDPNIHISVKLSRPKVIMEAMPSKIVGVYNNIFQIEINDDGHPFRHTFQYGDILTGCVRIQELDFVPMVSILNKK